MSRTGSKPIFIPEGVQVNVGPENVVTVKGPKGQLVKQMPGEMKITVTENELLVERPSDKKEHRALHGLTRSLIANMVQGVIEGYQKTLELVGVGYRASKQGSNLVLSVGYSHPVTIKPAPGVEIEVPAPNKIVVKGIDKQIVGDLAAHIRSIRKPEPYKGKGIKYEGEQVRRKVGKAGK